MTVFKLFSCLMASACVVGATVPAALAQPLAATTLLAQAAVDPIESQPVTPDDLAAEGLTDEQMTQIAAIFDTYAPQIDAAMDEYEAALAVLNDLLVPTTADLAIIDARNNVVTAGQQVDDLLFERNMALRGVLDLEQRQAINDYLRTLLGLGTPDPVAVFPQTLVGQDITTTLASLQADGWELVVQTPGYMGLNRGSEQLDLAIGRQGMVLGAELE